jgi:hypothetical protein
MEADGEWTGCREDLVMTGRWSRCNFLVSGFRGGASERGSVNGTCSFSSVKPKSREAFFPSTQLWVQGTWGDVCEVKGRGGIAR